MDLLAATLIAAIVALSCYCLHLKVKLADSEADNRQFIADFNADRELIEALANAVDDTAKHKRLMITARERALRRAESSGTRQAV